MKLSACLIVRDEAANLAACLESIRPHVDEICVLDTGSTDDSPAIAKRYAHVWERWTGCNDAQGRIMDFSAARNRNLAQATGDAVLWVDGDDVLVGGDKLRQAIQEAPRGADGSFALLAAYEYDRDAQGRVTTLQWRERIVAPRAGFEWRGPVHEGLLARAGTVPAHSQTELFRVVHRRRETGKAYDPERNLRILRAWFDANGEADVRLMHYFGAELLLNKHIGEAMHWFRRHAAISNWSDERCLSLLHLARIHLALNDGTEAARYAVEAMTTKSWPEPLWLMGQAYCLLSDQGIDREHNLRRGCHFLESGMRFSDAPTLLMTDPTVRFEACHWLSIAKSKLGLQNEAIAMAEQGLAGMPEHEAMRANLREWKAERARQQVRAGAVELHQLGALAREAGVVIEKALRGEVKFERAPAPIRNGNITGSTPMGGRLDIVFFLGHQLEPWTPRTLEANGMGGSETMAWEMAKRLAKMGHRVRVFAHVDEEYPCCAGDYEGVWWMDERAFSGITCDLLICSRRFDAVHRAQFKAAVLWVHDVHVGEHFQPRDAVKFDFIWCLSNWHKQFFCSVYPWLSPSKVEVTRNGIDAARFDRRDVVRHPHRAIYSSSPDRGLAEAVAAWPAVRERVPDAELHVYYGFDNWERSLELGGENGIPHCSRASLEALKKAVASTPGVVMHGRVNQKELAEAMLGAGVWFYPTWFSETSCITAMEAQAAGLWCVCPPLAALAETVAESNRCWGEDDPVKSALWAFRLARKDVALGSDEHSLDTLAIAWNERLTKLVAEAESNIVPKFVETAQ